MDRDAFIAQFEAEARRLRLNPWRLGALSASADATGWEGALLERMRGLAPGVAWADVFSDGGAEQAGRGAELESWAAEADAEPEGAWHELDEVRTLGRELDRVIPPALRLATVPGARWGLSFPHGRAHALAVLRQMSDGAGTAAFLAALAATPPVKEGSDLSP
jgi:hypothetical protein